MLASLGHRLDLISFASKSRPHDLNPLPSICDSIELLDRDIENLSLQKNYLGRLKSLLTFQCYSIERFRSEAMLQSVNNHLRLTQYDLILCDSIYGLINVPQTPIPILLNCHNVEHAVFSRYVTMERNPIKKCYASLESSLMRSAESKGCSRISHAMVCSRNDREMLQKLRPNLASTVVPNVVDTDSITPAISENPSDKGPVLLFQGIMDWYPNRDAVEYFARNIFPQIQAECPLARFVVAGRNPPKDFVESFKLAPNIEFTGTVPDMRPYLGSASVVVIPLRLGGGTRIKILEACAAGKPVVSTTIGAEGLDLAPGKEILLADKPTEFARCVTSLLRDPNRGETLASAARVAVVARFSHATLKKTLDTIVSKYPIREPRAVKQQSSCDSIAGDVFDPAFADVGGCAPPIPGSLGAASDKTTGGKKQEK
jgi:glycosyltransferase involved in cell wall biosynthesis